MLAAYTKHNICTILLKTQHNHKELQLHRRTQGQQSASLLVALHSRHGHVFALPFCSAHVTSTEVLAVHNSSIQLECLEFTEGANACNSVGFVGIFATKAEAKKAAKQLWHQQVEAEKHGNVTPDLCCVCSWGKLPDRWCSMHLHNAECNRNSCMPCAEKLAL